MMRKHKRQKIKQQHYSAMIKKKIILTLFFMFIKLSNECWREINPSESMRTYSSISSGRSLSMLDSSDCWTSKDTSSTAWMRIDLGEIYYTYGVIIQHCRKCSDYIKSFNIEYSQDGISYTSIGITYQAQTTTYDSSRRFYYYFPNKYYARYIRIRPQTWTGTLHLAVRAGVIGYASSYATPCIIPPSGKIFAYTTDYLLITGEAYCASYTDNICSCISGYYLLSTDTTRCLSPDNSNGYYLDFSNIYMPCWDRCNLCTSSGCTQCISSYYPLENDMKLCELSPRDGYYLDTTSSILRKCSTTMCITCTERADKCITCITEKYKIFNPTTEQADKCYSSADLPQHYFDGGDSLFKICDVSCNGCTSNPRLCNTCAAEYYLKEIELAGEEKYCFRPQDFTNMTVDPSINKLRICDVTCNSCSADIKRCIACSNNYYKLIDGSGPTLDYCYTSYTDYYLDTTNIILNRCDISCNQCTGSNRNCNACNSNYYKKENADDATLNYCYQSISRYYLDSSTNIFKICDLSCAECSTESKNCSQCSSNFYKLENASGSSINYCYSSFLNHYIDSTNNILRSCDISCNECSNESKNCTACNDTYYKLNDASGASLNYCYQSHSGYFLDTSLNILKRCDVSCTQCSVSDKNCSTCSVNYYKLFDGSGSTKDYCYQSYSGYYLDTANNNFKKCDGSCLECSGSAKNCVTCTSNYYKLKDATGDSQNYCYTSYLGYFIDNTSNLLIKCDISCSQCSNSYKNCNTCNPSYYKIFEGTGETADYCYQFLSGYHLNSSNNLLEKCDISCTECSLSYKNCSTCSVNYFKIINGAGETKDYCYSSYLGYYIDNVANVLKKCDISCYKCTLSDKNCLTCTSNYYKLIDGSGETKDYCYLNYSGYYLDASVNIFKKCDLTCKECDGSLKNCLICKENHYRVIDATGETQNYCYTSFPNYYLDSIKKIFKQCDLSCKECQGNSKNCSTCSTAYFKVFASLGETQNHCYKELTNHYLDNSQNILKKCDNSCFSCQTTAKNCIECNSGFYRLFSASGETKDYCYSKYPGHFVNYSSKMIYKCDSSCNSCEISASNCIECAENNYKIDQATGEAKNLCYTAAKGYYFDSTSKSLKRCSKSCTECFKNENNCMICNPGFYKISGADVISKDFCHQEMSGFYLDSNQSLLIKCDLSCKKCIDNPNKCVECQDGYYRLEESKEDLAHRCFDKYNGFYADEPSNLMKQCDKSCKECIIGSKNCVDCSENYFKKEDDESNQCYEATSDFPGFYLDLKASPKIYNKCHLTCLTCQNEAMNCLECVGILVKDPVTNKCNPKIDNINTESSNASSSHAISDFGDSGGRKITLDYLKKHCFKNYEIISKNLLNTFEPIFKVHVAHVLDKKNKDCVINNQFLSFSVSLTSSTIANNKNFKVNLNDLKGNDIAEFETKYFSEGEYTILLEIFFKNERLYKSHKTIFIIVPSIKAVIKNEDNLSFDYGEEIELNAQLSFIEGGSQTMLSNIKYEWEIDQKFYEVFDTKNLNLKEKVLIIKKEDYVLKSPNMINENSELSFIISFKMSFNHIETEKKLSLKIGTSKKPNKIIFKIDSNFNPENFEFIKFSPIFLVENFPIKNYNFLWTVSDFKNKEELYLTGRQELKLKIKTSDLIEKNNNVTLSLFDKTTKENFFTNYFILSDFGRPFGGAFTVSPAIGISLKTLFKFNLKHWKTDTKILTFIIFFKDNNGKRYDITEENFVLTKPLMGKINEASFEISSDKLPVTNAVYVEIKDSLGISVIESYAVKVVKNQNPPKQADLLSKISSSDIVEYSKMKYILKTNIDNMHLNIPQNFISNSLEKLENTVNSIDDPTFNRKQVKIFSEISSAKSNNSNIIFDNLINVGDSLINKINPADNLRMTETIYSSLEGMVDLLGDVNEEERLEKILKKENLEKTITEKLLENIFPGENLMIENLSFQNNVKKFSTLNPQKLDVEMSHETERLNKKKRKKGTKIRRLQSNQTSSCSEGAILCLDSNFTTNLLNQTSSDVMGFNAKVFKNKNIPIESNSTQSVFSENSLDFKIGVGDSSGKKLRYLNELPISLANNIYYEVRLKIPPNTNQSVIDETTCTQYEKGKINFCSSWYDYDVNEVICLCQSQSLITNMKNKDFSKLSKLAQFQNLSSAFLNEYYILLLALLIMSLIIFLSLGDHIDRNIMKYNLKKFELNPIKRDIIQYHNIEFIKFNFHKELRFKNVFFYLVKSTHPIISIMNTYNEAYTITLAFMDLYMNFILSYFFNLLPYLMIENTDFKDLYSTRNIKYKMLDKDNLNLFFKQIYQNVIFSIISHIVVFLIITILNTIMYRNLLLDDITSKEKNLNELLCYYFETFEAKKYKIKLRRGLNIIGILYNLSNRKSIRPNKKKLNDEILNLKDNSNFNIKDNFDPKNSQNIHKSYWAYINNSIINNSTRKFLSESKTGSEVTLPSTKKKRHTRYYLKDDKFARLKFAPQKLNSIELCSLNTLSNTEQISNSTNNKLQIDNVIKNLEFVQGKSDKKIRKINKNQFMLTIKDRDYLFNNDLDINNININISHFHLNSHSRTSHKFYANEFKVSCAIVNIRKLTNANELAFMIRKYSKYSLSMIIIIFIYLFMGIICSDIHNKFGKNSFTIIFLPVLNFFILKLVVVANLKKLISTFLLLFYDGLLVKIKKSSCIGAILIKLFVPNLVAKHYELVKLFYKIYK